MRLRFLSLHSPPPPARAVLKQLDRVEGEETSDDDEGTKESTEAAARGHGYHPRYPKLTWSYLTYQGATSCLACSSNSHLVLPIPDYLG